MSQTTRIVLDELYEYCRARDFRGPDPYDGLNSRVFNAMPFSSNRTARIVQTQLFKRSPIDLRRIAHNEVTHNPKALGLFLSAASGLYGVDSRPEYREDAYRLAALLEDTRSQGCSGACWGYDFPWEARVFSQPRHAPTVVATVFAANALADAGERFDEPRFLRLARSTCDFLLNDLNRTGESDSFCFSYSPKDQTQVFNSSMLVAQLLARVSVLAGEPELACSAAGAARFVAEHQEADGSWLYGMGPHQRWIDSFHTGYILVALADYASFTGDSSVTPALEAGYRYYADAFFGADGRPLWTPARRHPYDTHNAAQGIITFVRMGDLKRAQAVARWTIENMRDPSGYFYYRRGRLFTIRIPYMRWCQAFMTLALVRLQEAII